MQSTTISADVGAKHVPHRNRKARSPRSSSASIRRLTATKCWPLWPRCRSTEKAENAQRGSGMRSAVLAAGFLLCVAAPAPAQPESGAAPPSVSLPPELLRVLTDYESAWRARDAGALARLFADDGFVLPGGSPPVRGRCGDRAALHGLRRPALPAGLRLRVGRDGRLHPWRIRASGRRARRRKVHSHAPKGRREEMADRLRHGQREPAGPLIPRTGRCARQTSAKTQIRWL